MFYIGQQGCMFYFCVVIVVIEFLIDSGCILLLFIVVEYFEVLFEVLFGIFSLEQYLLEVVVENVLMWLYD